MGVASQHQNIETYIRMKKEKICLGIAALSALYAIFKLFEVTVVLSFLTLAASLVGFVYFRWKALRKTGIISKLSPQMQALFLNRSILDVYRDVVYFPLVTKVIGAFIKGAVQKPPPEQLHTIFEDLPTGFQEAINKKGILSLAPERVQRLLLQQQDPDLAAPPLVIPRSYGAVVPAWDKMGKYEQQEIKIHERTFGKEMILGMNEKVQWGHILGLAAIVGYGLMKTRGKKMGKIFLYNGSAAGVVLLVVLVLVKFKKPGYSSRLRKKI